MLSDSAKRTFLYAPAISIGQTSIDNINCSSSVAIDQRDVAFEKSFGRVQVYR